MTVASIKIPVRCWPKSWLRHSTWDSLFLGLAFLHGAALAWIPSVPLIALGLWWNANTIAHNFIHQPFFRARLGNRFFSAYLSLVLGLPQTLWRDRHLAHHAGRPWCWRWSAPLLLELLLVLGLWSSLMLLTPGFFLTVYLPGFSLGLGLCFLQGHYEHIRGTVSHYGKLYNWLFFNDGYHVEHHARPGEHWTQLPHYATPNATVSRWPAVLRWLESWSLNLMLTILERQIVLRSPTLQRFMLERHERAFRALLARLPAIRCVEIVGAGLFPRTAMILQRLLPQAELVLIDQNATHLQMARRFLQGQVEFRQACYPSSDRSHSDAVVIPLTFNGDREAIYRQPPASIVLVHDWLWVRRGEGVVISYLLLKRLNCVRQYDRI